MNKLLLNIILFFSITCYAGVLNAQTYHPEDKEGLRTFLRQPSAYGTLLNLERAGLTIADTVNWKTSEEWLPKVVFHGHRLGWDESTPKRLRELIVINRNLAGVLNCEKFTNLKFLACYQNELTSVDVSKNPYLEVFNCLSNKLTTLDVSNSPKLSVLECQYNQLQTLDVTKNKELTALYCGFNQLSVLDLSQQYGIFKYLKCDNNNIYKLVLPANGAGITTLLVENNQLKFSTLPYPYTPAVGNYSYAPQQVIDGGTVPSNVEIDLSSEYNTTLNTTYKWYNDAGTEVAMENMSYGRFVAGDIHGGKTLTCKMTNPLYPQLVLEYKVKITQVIHTYHPDDKEGLRAFLRQRSAYGDLLNLERAGLTIADTLNWRTSEEWVGKVVFHGHRLGWDESTPKRLRELIVINRNLAGVLNCEKFTNLKFLACYQNELTSVNVSKNANLEVLNCLSNKLTTLNVSNNPKLTVLECQYNQLQNLDVSNNPELVTLYCQFNQLFILDVLNNLKLTALKCNDNNIQYIYLPFSITLSALSVENNQLKFSTLPRPSQVTSSTYSYAPQQPIYGGTVSPSQIIDLSSEHGWLAGWGTPTIYKWHNSSGVEVSMGSWGNGKFVAESINAGKALTCIMTSSLFPQLMQEYIVNISGTEVRSALTSNPIEEAAVSIYPNPVIDNLVVNSPNTINSIEVYDMSGHLVKSIKETPATNFTVPLSDVASGVYILKLITPMGTSTHRIKKN